MRRRLKKSSEDMKLKYEKVVFGLTQRLTGLANPGRLIRKMG